MAEFSVHLIRELFGLIGQLGHLRKLGYPSFSLCFLKEFEVLRSQDYGILNLIIFILVCCPQRPDNILRFNLSFGLIGYFLLL